MLENRDFQLFKTVLKTVNFQLELLPSSKSLPVEERKQNFNAFEMHKNDIVVCFPVEERKNITHLKCTKNDIIVYFLVVEKKGHLKI